MSDDEPIRDKRQRDVREAINNIRKIVDESQQKEPELLDVHELLLMLGHVVSILDSEWGTMMRILERQQGHHDLLMGKSEDSLTLANLYKESLVRKRLQKYVLAVIIGTLILIGWLVMQNHQANRQRDQMMELLLKK